MAVILNEVKNPRVRPPDATIARNSIRSERQTGSFKLLARNDSRAHYSILDNVIAVGRIGKPDLNHDGTEHTEEGYGTLRASVPCGSPEGLQFF